MSSNDRHAQIGAAGGHGRAAERHYGPADADRPSTGPLGRRQGRRRRGGGRELVPPAQFQSYYGRSILKKPVWESRDIAGYLFLGGWAGGSAILGAGGALTGRPQLRRFGRTASFGAAALSFVALVHDLGRPARFLNMLRVAKPTSPMSMGTWLLAVFGPATAMGTLCEYAGVLPLPQKVRKVVALASTPADVGAAIGAPFLMTYTAVLIADTAVPAWHGASKELPYWFAGSGLAAAGGLASALLPEAESAPAQTLAIVGACTDLVAERVAHRSLGMVEEALSTGKAGRLLRAARYSNAAGAALLALGRGRSRAARIAGGTLLFGGSICTRFGIFAAGMTSAEDPKYTVIPQRERLDARNAAEKS